MAVKIIEGDCLASLAALPPGIAQTCVTSPPYYGLRDYGHDGQIGLEDTPDAYVARLVDVFREVRRVLRDDGTLWLNLGDSYAAGGNGGGNKNDTNAGSLTVGHKVAPLGYKPKDLLGIPWMVAFALRADGWFLRADCIWAKANPMPESVRDRPTKAHEYVFLLSKSARYYYDADAIREPNCPEVQAAAERYRDDPRIAEARRKGNLGAAPDRADSAKSLRVNNNAFANPDGRNARSVWTIATQPYSGAHFATMPPDLAERCIKAGSSERGQCPHCGSPWQRVIGHSGVTRERNLRINTDKAQAGVNAAHKLNGKDYVHARQATGEWSPSCACPAHAPVPQTVLDPFGGAGTTGLVADRLGRNALLCELNPEYAALARARLTDDAPLLAVVA